MVNLEETKYHVDFGEYYVRMTDKQKHYLVVRSVIDRILAGIALVILSPLFLIVSIAQKISAPDEPVFFLQKRVGKNAHCFNRRLGRPTNIYFKTWALSKRHQY